MEIGDLPDEILTDIFFNLSPNLWYSSLQCTCRRWRRIVELLYRKISTLDYDGSTEKVDFVCFDTTKRFSISYYKKDLLRKIIGDCGSYLKHLSVDVDDNNVNFARKLILWVAQRCPKLSSLVLCGSIILAIRKLNLLLPHLSQLQKFVVREDSFIDSEVMFPCEEEFSTHQLEQDEGPKTTAQFFESVLASSPAKLRDIEFQFPYVIGPDAACFEHIKKLNLEKFICLLYKPYSPDYVETILNAVCCFSPTLNHFDIFMEIKACLDNQWMKSIAGKLASMPHLKYLAIGFQLMSRSVVVSDRPEEQHDDLENDRYDVYYDSTDEAPWSQSFLANSGSGYNNLQHLTLRNFDMKFRPDETDTVSATFCSLRHLLHNLTSLTLEDNYFVDDMFLSRAFCQEMPNLKILEISRATLSYSALSRIVTGFTPALQKLTISNVQGLSFKYLIIALHSYLHQCCSDVNIEQPSNNRTLVVQLGTAAGFYHNEASELQNAHLCSLEPLTIHYNRVKIYCRCRPVN